MTSTSQVAKFEAVGEVSLRVGGHGQDYVGQTVPAKTKSGGTKYVVLLSVIEDYGQGDVVTYRVKFA